MDIFVDESGIHLTRGHSVFAVVFVGEEHTQAVEQGLQTAQARIGQVPMHWAKLRWENRLLAFRTIRKLPITFQIAVFNNPITNADKAVHETLGRILNGVTVSRIYIDGKKSKAYEARLKVTLRQAGITTRKLVTVEDENSAGVQIADLVAGLYRHQLDKPSKESSVLQALIAHQQK